MTHRELLEEAMKALEPWKETYNGVSPSDAYSFGPDGEPYYFCWLNDEHLRQVRTTYDKIKAALGKPNHNEQLAVIFNNLAARQQPMDHEIEKAWSENTEELYEP